MDLKRRGSGAAAERSCHHDSEPLQPSDRRRRLQDSSASAADRYRERFRACRGRRRLACPRPWRPNTCDSARASACLRTSSQRSQRGTPWRPRHRAYSVHARRNFRGTQLPPPRCCSSPASRDERNLAPVDCAYSSSLRWKRSIPSRACALPLGFGSSLKPATIGRSPDAFPAPAASLTKGSPHPRTKENEGSRRNDLWRDQRV
jgi:hypothetical protein